MDATSRSSGEDAEGADPVSAEAGRRFRLARLRHGVDQARVAEVAGISEKTVSAFETGVRAVKFSSVVGMCDALGIPLGWLACGLPDVGDARLRREWSR